MVTIDAIASIRSSSVWTSRPPYVGISVCVSFNSVPPLSNSVRAKFFCFASCSVSHLRSPKAPQTSGHYVVLPASFRATRRPRFYPFPRHMGIAALAQAEHAKQTSKRFPPGQAVWLDFVFVSSFLWEGLYGRLRQRPKVHFASYNTSHSIPDKPGANDTNFTNPPSGARKVGE